MECSVRDIDETRIDVRLIKVLVEGFDLDFESAKEISSVIADKEGSSMLLSWYDPVEGRHFPDVDCCGEDVPSWYVYGKSRGAKLLVDVQGYKFFYL
jgi:hypothetical protein